METHGTKPDLENANWTLQGLRTSQIAVEESGECRATIAMQFGRVDRGVDPAFLATVLMIGESSDIMPGVFESDIVKATARCEKFFGLPFLSVRPSKARP